MVEMKKLIVGDGEYEIVDASARSALDGHETRITALEQSGGSGGASQSKMTFSRLPFQFYNEFNYQGWCQNNIVEYNGEYVALLYNRNSHTGSSYATKAIFFNGYEIDRIETCTIDGSSSGTVGSFIGIYKYDEKYYGYIKKQLYESTNLIDWTSVSGSAQAQYNVWSAFNINDTIYMSYDNGYNVIGKSTDNGTTITNIPLTFSGANENRNEASFVDVDGEIFAFFGKQWTTGTTSSESGYAPMAYTENGVWQTGKTTNIICNLGDTASYYDGEYIHVFAKSRLYHNNGGDASILRHYQAKVANAKEGTFEYVERIDNYDEEIPRYALDSTSVSVYMKADGTGLLISPVSVASGRMYYQFYAVNAGDVGTILSTKYENEIAQLQSKTLSNEVFNIDAMRTMTYYDASIDISNHATVGEVDTAFSSNPTYVSGSTDTVYTLRDATRYIETSGCDEIFIEWMCPYITLNSDGKTYIGVVLDETGKSVLLTLNPVGKKNLVINDQVNPSGNNATFALADPKEIYLYKKGDDFYAYYRSLKNGMIKIFFDKVTTWNAFTYADKVWKINNHAEDGGIPFFAGQVYGYFSKLKISGKYTPFLALNANTGTSGTAFNITKELDTNSFFSYNANNATFLFDVSEFTKLNCTSWGDWTTSTWCPAQRLDEKGNTISSGNMYVNSNFTTNGAKYIAIKANSNLSNIETMATITPTA